VGVDRVRDAYVAYFQAHKMIAAALRAPLPNNSMYLSGGLPIRSSIRSAAAKAGQVLPDGVTARASAQAGKFVMAGPKGSEQAHPDVHGHVVVVVDGPLAHNAYPSSYWGSLGGQPGRNQTLNFAWAVEDRDRFSYAEHSLSSDPENS
jgi:hypothetical protein